MLSAGADRRIAALDGFRGALTIAVLVSHYFAEVPHGLRPLMFGWVGVDMFFVLSGFLIGRLILDKQECSNFFSVFYVRRLLRIVPAYILVVLVVWAMLAQIHQQWTDTDTQFPLWSYLTFTQTIFMTASNTIGAHWLAPTWTLAVEEQFYLLVPAMIVFTPRRFLAAVLIGVALFALAMRIAIYGLAPQHAMFALVMLPGRADLLMCGIFASYLLRENMLPWDAMLPYVRAAPIVLLTACIGLHLISVVLYDMISPLLMGIGGAAFMLAIVQRAPEARRFESRILQFFGNNSYCIYLTHLPILGLMHGFLLGLKPDIANSSQWAVTIAALPIAILVGWILTKTVEEPLTKIGRRWQWRREDLSQTELAPASTQ